MDAFKDTSALRKAVSFIIPAIHISSGSDSEKDAVSLAKKYITNNVSLNLSVKDVADYVHLSPEYFTKLFKKEVGQNIKSYILQVKVEIAKRSAWKSKYSNQYGCFRSRLQQLFHILPRYSKKIGRDHTN